MPVTRSNDSTTIAYETHGSGPVVVFVAAAGQHRAIDPTTSETAIKLATHGFETRVYDRRGRGGSGDQMPWSVEREVEDLLSVARDDGRPWAAVTSSSGAAVALEAATAGTGMAAAVLYEPPFFPGRNLIKEIDTIDELVRAGRNEEAMRFQLASVVGLPTAAVDHMATAPWWSGMVSVAGTLGYDLRACQAVNEDPDWSRRWKQVTIPVLVCSGGDSFAGMAAAADTVAGSLPSGTRVSLAGQGHMPTTAAYVPIVAEFLSTHLR